MQAPKRKVSPSKRNMRRSHHALKPVYLGICPNLHCKAKVRLHRACEVCGEYRGKNIESRS